MAHMNLMGLAFYEISTETTQSPLSDPETENRWDELRDNWVVFVVFLVVIIFQLMLLAYLYKTQKAAIDQATNTDVESQCSDAEEPCSPREASETTRLYFDFAGIAIDCRMLDDEEYCLMIASLMGEQPPAYQREVLTSEGEDPPAYVR